MEERCRQTIGAGGGGVQVDDRCRRRRGAGGEAQVQEGCRWRRGAGVGGVRAEERCRYRRGAGGGEVEMQEGRRQSPGHCLFPLEEEPQEMTERGVTRIHMIRTGTSPGSRIPVQAKVASWTCDPWSGSQVWAKSVVQAERSFQMAKTPPARGMTGVPRPAVHQGDPEGVLRTSVGGVCHCLVVEQLWNPDCESAFNQTCKRLPLGLRL